ncbi:MAG: chromosome segregation ATPase [Cyanobacteria bacterium P01_F01_bin.86]
MSSSQKFPKRNSRRQVPPPPPRSRAHDWQSVPSDRREQPPRFQQSTQANYFTVRPTPLADNDELTSVTPAAPPPQKQQGFLNSWTLWAFLMLVLVGGIGGASAVSLFRIPNLPNCRAIFWPTAAASTRLQCADAYAQESSVENLLAAIALVEELPRDHPLRPDINTRVEMWADQILDVADQTFHQGKLEDAIKIAQKIPQSTAAAGVVSDRIGSWQKTWEQAESIFQEAENHIKASRFQDAFAAAIQLRTVANRYWSSTQYDELMNLITRTREDVNILANAERQAAQGTVDDILQAIEQVASVASDSYVYEEAKATLKNIGRQLLDLAEEALARADGAEARNILSKIPPEAELGEEIADFRTLADAYELIWAGTTTGYESAIVRLQSMSPDRPLYSRVQELKQQWQWELEAVAQLNWAQQIAQPGSVDSLRTAIAEAQKVTSSNPLWDEAQDQIQQWREAIADIEDRPFLDRANIMASQGDRAGLNAAIAEAETIPVSSPLYDEAQDAIGDWRWRIQEMDNEPILAQAQQFAEVGRLEDAIAVASQIPKNQAFYDEAQASIANWQTDQDASQSYQQALLVSQSGSVSALVRAISLAQAIPENSSDWSAAQQAVNRWSWALLDLAEAAARQDVERGIEIAEQVPPRTEAYAEAQLRLREWQISFTSAPQ